MPLNFKCLQAELKGLNVRKEGSEENREIAIDLKFEGETSGVILKDLFGADHYPHFWMPNEDRDPLFNGIASIDCIGDYEGHELKFAKQHLRGVKVHKISVLPRPHLMTNITFTVTAQHPSQIVINAMTEMIRELGDVEVIGALDLFSNENGSIKKVGDEYEHTFRTGGDSHKQQDIEDAANEGSKADEAEVTAAIDKAVENDEELNYKQAVDLVTTTRKASVAYVKKELGIGYNKAARFIQRMQEENIISPPGVNSVREVLVEPA